MEYVDFCISVKLIKVFRDPNCKKLKPEIKDYNQFYVYNNIQCDSPLLSQSISFFHLFIFFKSDPI